jgi:hypothetical protein
VRVAPDAPAEAADGATTLAKKLQNPIGELISVPFQNNIGFGYGPNRGTQENINFQPVVPLHVHPDWNVIIRTVVPIVWQPSLQPIHTVPFGIGPSSVSAFLSPSQPTNGWLWGVGPVVQVPTITDSTLGSSVWGAGPTAVLVYTGGPWVAGVLTNAIWSLGGNTEGGGNGYNSLLLQPFVNYNFGGGWYVGSSPIVTASWPAPRNRAWTVPVGATAGRVVKIGTQPVNLSIGAYYNAIRPDFGPTWVLRTQVTFIF